MNNNRLLPTNRQLSKLSNILNDLDKVSSFHTVLVSVVPKQNFQSSFTHVQKKLKLPQTSAEQTKAGVEACAVFVCDSDGGFAENFAPHSLFFSRNCCFFVLFLSTFIFLTCPLRNYTLHHESSRLPTQAREWQARGRNEKRAKQTTTTAASA